MSQQQITPTLTWEIDQKTGKTVLVKEVRLDGTTTEFRDDVWIQFR